MGKVLCKGIDVSHWQGDVDFTKVKNSGYDFVILNAGYGKYINQKDPYFEQNYKNAKAAGLKIGAYWYAYATSVADAKAEAQIFMQVVASKRFDLPLFYDVEDECQTGLASETIGQMIDTFCGYVESQGYKTGLYSFRSFLNNHVPTAQQKKWDVWLAEFDVASPAYQGDYTIWQYTSTGRVGGVNGNCDCNYLYKDYFDAKPTTKTTPLLSPFDKYFDERIGVGLDYDGVYNVQCFTKDHYVLMADWTYKAIQDIQIGDKVIGYDNEVNTVVQLHRRKADVIKVRTDLEDITVTKDHPFYFLDGSFDSILAGDEKQYALFDKRNYHSSGLTDEELMMLGFWLGDGSLARHHDNRNPEIRITYGEKKRPFVESLNMISNVQPHTSGNGSCNASIRKREHPLLTEIIYRCYNEKQEKVLPLIFNSREYGLIIDGYIQADGCEKNGSYTVTSTSKSLLLSIQAAAIICGYGNKSIRPMKRSDEPIIINGKPVKNVKPIWRMTLVKKATKAHKRIQNVKYLGEEEVYNIGTDGTHTYICDNYKVHNCFDLANDYSVNLIGGKQFLGMGAYEIYTNFDNQPAHELYTKIPNTPEFVPAKGDIMVWGTGIGQWGHVAICTGEGDTTWFNSYDQNWNYANAPVTLVKHSYNSVLGVLRPKDQTKIWGYKGDVDGNGKIDVSDISKLSAHIKGIKAIDEKYIFNADVNGDGKIDVSDIATVSAHIKGVKAIRQDGTNTKPVAETKKKEQIYVVQKGDTLSGIAARYNTTYTKIAADNKISNPNLIYPGQKLVIK